MARKNREQMSEEQRDLADDLDKASALEAVANSEGGKLIQAGLVKDVVGVVDTLSMKYPTLTMQEFVAYCSDLKTKLDVYRALKRAKASKDYLQKLLEEALGE